MRLLLYILLSGTISPGIAISQEYDVVNEYYQDSKFVKIFDLEKNDWSINKDKLVEDKVTGKLIVFYNEEKTDTAAMVDVVEGEFQGLYKEWDKDYKYVKQECFYENGFRKGTCNDFLYFFPEEGHGGIHKDSIYIEIYEYECFIENGIDVQGEEVVKSKTIHRSVYENYVGDTGKASIEPNEIESTSKDSKEIKITPELSKGYIKLQINGKKGDVVEFGYYNKEGKKVSLSSATLVFSPEKSMTQYFNTEKGNGRLYILAPTDCKISYKFSDTK